IFATLSEHQPAFHKGDFSEIVRFLLASQICDEPRPPENCASSHVPGVHSCCGRLLGAYHPRVTIAQRPDLEVAFAEKADKLLKQVRRALIADREAVARGKFDRQKSKGEQISRMAAVDTADGAARISVTVALQNSEARELQAAGFATQAQIG